MVQFKKEEKEKHLIEYEITVDEERVKETLENIYREANRRMVIPGFRKGKAPRNILKTHLNQEFIHDELTRSLVPDALKQVVKDENINLFGEPDIEVMTASEGQPLVFRALVLEKPQVLLGNPEEIEIRKYHIIVRDPDIDQEIEGIRKSKGMWKEKEDLIIETGDMVKIKVDNKEYAIMAGFSDDKSPLGQAVVGLKKGETSRVRNNEDQEGQQSGEVVFTVVNVLKKELPDIDQAFLAQLNPEYKTVDDLRAKTRETLEKWTDDLVTVRMEKEALATLTRKSEVSIPGVLIDHEVSHRVDHFVEHIKKDGLTLEKYMELTNTDFDGIEKDFRKRALWDLKKLFVLEEYALKNNISIDKEEMDSELAKVAERTGKTVDEVKQVLERNNKLEDMRDQKLQQKMIGDILKKVKVKEFEDPLNLDQWKTLEDPEEEMVE